MLANEPLDPDHGGCHYSQVRIYMCTYALSNGATNVTYATQNPVI